MIEANVKPMIPTNNIKIWALRIPAAKGPNIIKKFLTHCLGRVISRIVLITIKVYIILINNYKDINNFLVYIWTTISNKVVLWPNEKKVNYHNIFPPAESNCW